MKQRIFCSAAWLALLLLVSGGAVLGEAFVSGVSASESPVFSVPYYPTPEKMDFCGAPVPLHVQDVWERFDREFTIVVYSHAQVYLWLKRMERYLPWIEGRLQYHNLPEDLKYVAIAESDLMPHARSPKNAAGPWQFIPSTGDRYGLNQQGSLDERYDFEMATESALRYLKDLYGRFGDWALAVAAYNCGEGRISSEMQFQNVSEYYFMKLPLETERYVFRILAIKSVLSNPERYGYHLPAGKGYPPHKVDRVYVNLSYPVPIAAVAEAANVTYREFKTLNPAFRSSQIPAGSYELKLPVGTGKLLGSSIESVKVRYQQASMEFSRSSGSSSKAKKPAAKYHKVKRGETLTGVANRYGVSVAELKQTNRLKKSTIVPGQKLRIPN